MSYSVVQPGAKVRPAVVSAATALLYGAAVLLLIQAVIGSLQVGPTRRVVDDFYADRPDERAAATAGFVVAIIATIVIYVLIAVALVVLGLLVGRGKQPARIITWVLAGLGVLCLGCGVAAGALSSSFGSFGSSTDSQALSTAISNAIPEWQNTVATVLAILSLIILVTVIVLLALPASNDFFRKEQEVWVPPTTWPSDPSGGVPPYQPPAPGTPPPQQ